MSWLSRRTAENSLYGRSIVDVDGRRIGRLRDVYVDIETFEPVFATVRRRPLLQRLAFVPFLHASIGPKELHVPVSRRDVKASLSIPVHGTGLSPSEEQALYAHFAVPFEASRTASGHRLARR